MDVKEEVVDVRKKRVVDVKEEVVDVEKERELWM